MKKIANYVGLGVLGTLGFGLLFVVISILIGFGNIFSTFGDAPSYASVLLLDAVSILAVVGLLIAFIVLEIIKVIPYIKDNEEDKSLFRMNVISGLLAIMSLVSCIFALIIVIMVGGSPTALVIIEAIFAAGALVCAILSYLQKNLSLLVRVILTLVATFLVLVITCMGISNDPLHLVYSIFAILALLGGLGYIVISNLDCFSGKANNKE